MQCRPVVTRVSVLMIASDTVRYYGLFSPAGRPQLTQARALLTATIVTAAAHTAQSPSSLPAATAPATTALCRLGNCDYWQSCRASDHRNDHVNYPASERSRHEADLRTVHPD